MKTTKNNFPKSPPPALLGYPFVAMLVSIAILHSAFATHPKAPEWKLDATVDNVEFYHAIDRCGGNAVVFLKFVNKNSQEAKVSWTETIKTQLRTEKNSFRGKQELMLPPGETLAQDCANAACKACMVMPEQVNPTYVAQIQDFAFSNIVVNK